MSQPLARASETSAFASYTPYADTPSSRPRALSAVYARTLLQAERFARHDRTIVLLEGEPGTGKTSLARYLHDVSPRRDRVFHRIDLGAIDDALSASDLFGHAAGAFTGANGRRHGHVVTADRGTLFLDEIGKASLPVQRKLLHLVEYGELTAVGTDRSLRVDVRIVAATNVSLESLVQQGDFLPDLLPRFGYFRIVVPPLRERRQDIPVLATSIVEAQAPQFGYACSAIPRIEARLLDALVAAPWRGNIRELVSAIQYLLVAADGHDVLLPEHCEGPLAYLAETGDEVERVRRAVAQAGSVSGAARDLGVARTTVYRHLRRADQGGALASDPSSGTA